MDEDILEREEEFSDDEGADEEDEKKERVTDDFVRRYLQDMAKVPMFSREDHEEEKAGKEMRKRRKQVFSALKSAVFKQNKKTTRIRQVLNNTEINSFKSERARRKFIKDTETVWEFIAGFSEEFGAWPSFEKIKEWCKERKCYEVVVKTLCQMRVEDLRDEAKLHFYLSKNAVRSKNTDILRKKFPSLHYKTFLRILREWRGERHKYWEARIFDELSSLPVLPKNVSKAMEGLLEIENEFVEANLRWVVSIAKNWNDKCFESKLSFLDLIEEGNCSLYHAARRFEPNKGFRFSTFSTWWIRQSIQRSIDNNSNTIRVPVHIVDKFKNISRVAVKLTQDLGREPTAEEIVEEFSQREDLRQKAQAYKLTPQKVRKILDIAKGVDSLDRPAGVDGPDSDTCLNDFIEDTSVSSPEEVVLRNNLSETLKGVLNKVLTPREERVISLRFGLEDGVPLSLEEVGAEFAVTRERIRQIEHGAFDKLRRSGKRRVLEIFLA